MSNIGTPMFFPTVVYLDMNPILQDLIGKIGYLIVKYTPLNIKNGTFSISKGAVPVRI